MPRRGVPGEGLLGEAAFRGIPLGAKKPPRTGGRRKHKKSLHVSMQGSWRTSGGEIPEPCLRIPEPPDKVRRRSKGGQGDPTAHRTELPVGSMRPMRQAAAAVWGCGGWHSRMDSDHQPAVLETAALPVELLLYEAALGIEPAVPTRTRRAPNCAQAAYRSSPQNVTQRIPPLCPVKEDAHFGDCWHRLAFRLFRWYQFTA